MKPLKYDPFYTPIPEHREVAQKEIIEFINDECKYAELPLFDGVSFTTSKERYKYACRVLRVSDKIEIRTSQGRIIACKLVPFIEIHNGEKNEQRIND